jgi:hexosaminidase
MMRITYRTLFAAVAFAVPLAELGAQTNTSAASISVIPRPESLVAGRGSFTLTSRTTIWSDRADSAVARRFARSLAPSTALELPVRIGTSSSGNRIVFRRAAARDTTLGPEGYRLNVQPGVVTITSSAQAGAFYATQTLLQLLPPDVYRSAPVSQRAWTIPAVKIEDRPRFSWRGMHLDVSRHFHAEGVRQEVHRPHRAAQNELLPLASHR